MNRFVRSFSFTLVCMLVLFIQLALAVESDSLDQIQEALQHRADMTIKEEIDFLIQKAAEYTEANEHESGIRLARRALELSKAIDHHEGIGMSFLRLGHNYHELGAFYRIHVRDKESEVRAHQTSLTYLDSAIVSAQLYGLKEVELESYFIKHYVHRLTLANEQALSELMIALELAKEMEAKSSYFVLSNISNLFYYAGQYDKALEYGFKRLKLIEDHRLDSYLKHAYLNIGKYFLKAGEFDRAQDFLNRAKELYEKSAETYLLVYCDLYLGQIAFHKNDLFRAESYFLQVQDHLTENKESKSTDARLATASLWLGNISLERSDLSRALKNYSMAYQIVQDGYNVDVIIETLIHLAEAHSLNNDLVEADNYFKEALRIASSMGYRKDIMDTYESMAKHYQRIGDSELTLTAMNKVEAYRDTLFDEKSRMQIQVIKMEYDADVQEKENELLRKESEFQELRLRYLMAVLVAVICLVGIVLLLYFQSRKRKRQLESQNQLISEKNQELDVINKSKDKLFSIVAHDLRSPMVGLQGIGEKLEFYIEENLQDKLMEMGAKIDQSIDHLNHLLNNLLNWAASEMENVSHNPTTFPLNPLIKENIDLYKSLAQSKDIEITHKVDELEIFADINATSAIIRNMLSNAVKFTVPGGKIHVSSRKVGAFLRLSVKDEGPGINEIILENLFSGSLKAQEGSNGEKGFGLGLKLCKDFAERNGGEIGFESFPGKGTIFTVSLPCTESFPKSILEVA